MDLKDYRLILWRFRKWLILQGWQVTLGKCLVEQHRQLILYKMLELKCYDFKKFNEIIKPRNLELGNVYNFVSKWKIALSRLPYILGIQERKKSSAHKENLQLNTNVRKAIGGKKHFWRSGRKLSKNYPESHMVVEEMLTKP